MLVKIWRSVLNLSQLLASDLMLHDKQTMGVLVCIIHLHPLMKSLRYVPESISHPAIS